MRAIKVIKDNYKSIMKDSVPIVLGQDREMMGNDRPKPFVKEMEEHLGGYYVNLGDSYEFVLSYDFRAKYSGALPKDETLWFDVHYGSTKGDR